jgi:hypothetical protein
VAQPYAEENGEDEQDSEPDDIEDPSEIDPETEDFTDESDMEGEGDDEGESDPQRGVGLDVNAGAKAGHDEGLSDSGPEHERSTADAVDEVDGDDGCEEVLGAGDGGKNEGNLKIEA